MAVAAARFRDCPVTGLKVHRPAELLFTANAVMGVLSLALAGLFALLQSLTRMPQVGLLGDKAYYLVLTGHGVFGLIYWMLFFEVAAIIFVSTMLLNARMWSPGLGWASFILMAGAWVMSLWVILAGQADVLFTAYVPLIAHPVFYLAYLLLAIGVMLAIINYAATVVLARAEGVLKGSLPLLTYGVGVACILGLLAIASGAIALFPAFLYAAGWLQVAEPVNYRIWFWGLGHTLQYVNVTAMVVSWYALAALTIGASPLNERFTRIAFILYALVSFPVLGHHFIVDPTLSPTYKIVGATILGFGLGVPSLMHGLAVVGGLEAQVRASGHTGLLGWIGKLPWRNPGMGALLTSLILFGIGGFFGTFLTTYQLNLIGHNTTLVLGHFHGVVVGGTTMAFMGLAYILVPLVVQRHLWSAWLARWQPYVYGLGLLVLMFSMFWGGFAGLPRRTPDVTYGGLGLSSWTAPSTLLGIGAIIAVLGGIMFVLNIVLTLIAGKKRTTKVL